MADIVDTAVKTGSFNNLVNEAAPYHSVGEAISHLLVTASIGLADFSYSLHMKFRLNLLCI